MTATMRQTTLQTVGLGTVIDIFQRGRMPAKTGDLVDAVFGKASDRGSLVIFGSQWNRGAGKTMQLSPDSHHTMCT